jgi:hypothetical protein
MIVIIDAIEIVIIVIIVIVIETSDVVITTGETGGIAVDSMTIIRTWVDRSVFDKLP